jgi:hypothetical protein
MAYKNELSNSDTPYIHGPYIVFEDGSTFSTAEDSCIAVLTQDGEDHLNDANDFKAFFDIDDADAIFISLGDLIEAYNQVHGTNI